MESILTSIKKLLGIEEEYIHFDSEITMHINYVFTILLQLGIGPVNGFLIADSSATWVDFIGERIDLEAIKTYTYLKVRLAFDPPQNSFLVTAIENQIKELDWRLCVQAEGGV